jgi:hypothetical protein
MRILLCGDDAISLGGLAQVLKLRGKECDHRLAPLGRVCTMKDLDEHHDLLILEYLSRHIYDAEILKNLNFDMLRVPTILIAEFLLKPKEIEYLQKNKVILFTPPVNINMLLFIVEEFEKKAVARRGIGVNSAG